MEALDEVNEPYGHAQDFEKPKQFVHFDPFADTVGGLGEQSELDSQYQALRYDDHNKMRASILLDIYQQELESLDPEHATIEDRILYEQVTNLMNYLKTVKIIDAPILLKIYGLYRCRV